MPIQPAQDRWQPPCELFRLCVERQSFGVACVNAKDNRFLWCNDFFANIIGHTPAGLIGETWMSVTASADLAEDLQAVEEVLDGTRDSYQMFKRYLHKRGYEIPIHLEVFRYPRDGEMVCLLATVQEDSITASRAEDFRNLIEARAKQQVVEVETRLRDEFAKRWTLVEELLADRAALKRVAGWLPAGAGQWASAGLLGLLSAVIGWLSRGGQ